MQVAVVGYTRHAGTEKNPPLEVLTFDKKATAAEYLFVLLWLFCSLDQCVRECRLILACAADIDLPNYVLSRSVCLCVKRELLCVILYVYLRAFLKIIQCRFSGIF